MHCAQIPVPRPELDFMFELVSITLMDLIRCNRFDSLLYGWDSFSHFLVEQWCNMWDGVVKANLYFLYLLEGGLITAWNMYVWLFFSWLTL